MIKKITVIALISSINLFGAELYTEMSLPVLKSEKIEKTIVNREPYIDCQYLKVNKKEEESNVIAKTINENKYGIIGGLIGSQIGGGSMIVASTIAGSIVGSNIEKEKIEKIDLETAKDKTETIKEECVKRYKQTYKKEIVGYKNYTKFNNKDIVKITRDQINKIEVKIKVNY